MAIESISRPFTLPTTAPPIDAPISQIIAARNCIINPGRNGAVKIMGGSVNLTITFYMVNKTKEKSQ
jgi:hypothetical protein